MVCLPLCPAGRQTVVQYVGVRLPRRIPMERLARFCYRHRWRVLIAWIVAFIGMGVLSGVVGNAFSNNFSSPGTESQRAFDLLRSRFPSQSGDTAIVVFKAA